MAAVDVSAELSELVYARGLPARRLAAQIIQALTPESAPVVLDTLLARWQAACVDPRHDWRWSEAAVAHVFSAFPLAALPLLRSWLAPTSFRLADLPLVGLAVLGLKQVDTRSDRDLRNEIFCAPYRLLGQYGG
ncbi:MAG: hypothetical protein KA765_08035, partial [Thermoflexales bacterium]|nr:hypothetical protein [Thermoflexales bacterium]